jgi:hypothetical protein
MCVEAYGDYSLSDSLHVRYAIWDATGWHRDRSPPVWRNRATEEQKRIGWEMGVRIEKVICMMGYEIEGPSS